MAISNRTLLKIAAIGGIITCTTGVFAQWKTKDRIRQAEYYREAFKALRAHNGAKSLLGEPIKEGDFELTNKSNYCNNEKAHFEVSVKGTRQKGILYFWANKIQENNADKWSVNRIELGLDNEPDKRLLIKDTDKAQI